MTLTAEITVELTKRDLVCIKQGSAVGYVILKSVLINDKKVPIQFTIRTTLMGATFRKKGRRRGR